MNKYSIEISHEEFNLLKEIYHEINLVRNEKEKLIIFKNVKKVALDSIIMSFDLIDFKKNLTILKIYDKYYNKELAKNLIIKFQGLLIEELEREKEIEKIIKETYELFLF